MCGLARYLEEEGLATAGIGYIRTHMEKIKPPRGLAVPFELGRPMGAPNEPKFQRKVLSALLDLFAARSGPVLVDFPELAPGAPADLEGWTCPVSLAPPPDPLGEREALEAALQDEIARLRPWYDEAVRARKRTTYGISGLAPEEIPPLIRAFAEDQDQPPAADGTPAIVKLKLATDDLKSFYFEAATAKPGRISDVALADWLWAETAAGKALLNLRAACVKNEDPVINRFGMMSLLPGHQRDKAV